MEQKYDKNIWLVLRNKYEIYLFIKEMKKKKEMQQIWHLEIFHII